MKSKKIVFLFITIAFGVFIWYFFLKTEDYQINFKVNTTVGTVNQSIKSWNTSLPNFKVIKQIEENYLIQPINQNNNQILYHWKLNKLNDTLVQVKVNIKDTNNSFKNRLDVLFNHTGFKKESIKNVENFFKLLKTHLKETKVKIEGVANIKSTKAACVEVNTTQIEKAKGMMANFSLLSNFIVEEGLTPNGYPFNHFTKWDKKTDSIAYCFCFPFKDTVKVKQTPLIKIKQFSSNKAIKAIYNGNYIASDRAWYALENYATSNNLSIQLLPIEVFHNNPNMGGNEEHWVTEVYLPIE